MISPFLVVTFVFYYLPLLGWSFAFMDYIPGVPIFEQQFVGLKYFRIIFSGGNDFLLVMKNTLSLSFLGLATAPIPVIFAIMLSEVRHSKLSKTIQTLTSIPNFISWILVYAIAFALFSSQEGMINKILLDWHVIDKPLEPLISSTYAWYFQILIGLWKGTGWGAIIYIAAIAGIDQEQYEAAEIDGAGRFRKIWHVTIPGILPTFFVLLLLAISNILSNGFEQYYVFQNAMNSNKLEVFDTYIYRMGIANAEYAFSTAMGIFKSVISIILLLSANSLSKAVRKESII
ncbi:sugar ABC transporter permease [Cohnella herbarum]|uniref:Sugar ABC transporter permease n=2 Tax=Cohnella herbarum TaxID=2728023 RepID=A0A7Z2VSW2_9BACL|nr:sugar ABC transporter permease [Cohnella herbarum]